MLSTDFYYNGIKSVDIGVYLVKLSNDFTKTPFLAEKEIIEEEIPGNDRPYFFGVKRKPLTLKLTLSCVEGQWTYDKRREIARWFNVDEYAVFYSTDEPQKQYYCQYVGGIELNYTGTLQGYVEVEMRCDSPYAYSPAYTQVFDVVNSFTYRFENTGDDVVKPEVWIRKTGAGDVTITNKTYPYAKVFKLTGLVDLETVYVDSENDLIETDQSNTYRYNNFSDGYLSLPRGVNELLIEGSCTITFKWQFFIKG